MRAMIVSASGGNNNHQINSPKPTLTKQGFWLVEIKSWPGHVRGDAGTWTRTHNGKTISEDNPVMLANRKAKALVSLLKSQQSTRNIKVPWMEAIVR